MKKTIVFIVLLLTTLPLFALNMRRVEYAGYRVGDSEMLTNSTRIVRLGDGGEEFYLPCSVTDVSSDVGVSLKTSMERGQKLIRWWAYSSTSFAPETQTVVEGHIVTNAAHVVYNGETTIAKGDYMLTWTYGTTSYSPAYVAVDYDYIKYNLSYNANGGSGGLPSSENGIIFTNSVEIASNDLSRKGYTWSGWTNNLTTTVWMGGEIVSSRDLGVDWCIDGSNVVLYAKWRPHTYTVNFDKNTWDDVSGEMPPMLLTYDVSTNLTSNAFMRVGYKFSGWAIEEDGPVVHKNSTSVANLTSDDGGVFNLYAVWSAKKFSIKYHRNDGSGKTRTQGNQYFDDPTEILSESPRTGYVFRGWATSPDGGVEYEAGNKYPIDPEDKDVIDLYAVWAPIEYTVKFDANGGNGEMADAIVKYDAIYTIPDCVFIKTNLNFKLNFKGWATNITMGVAFSAGASVSNLTTKATEDGGIITFYAIWTEPRYIAFAGNGADNPDAMAEDTMTFDGVETKPLIANKFEKTGYAFDGWATNAPVTVTATPVAYTNCENVISTDLWKDVFETNVLYAVWQPNTYTVVFDPNGGTGSMDDQDFRYDQKKELLENKFAMDRLGFWGWATNKTGAVVFGDQETVSNLTAEANGEVMLYAVWGNGPLSDAMHCNNLVWESVSFEDLSPWEVAIGPDEGYNPSGSSVSNCLIRPAVDSKILQPDSSKISAAQSGMLSFWYRTSDTDNCWLTLTAEGFAEEAIEIEPSLEWAQFGPTNIANISSVRIGFHRNVGPGSTVWIDRMTWEPEDSGVIKLSLQNALVNGIETNEPYSVIEGGTSVKRGYPAPQVSFMAELAPIDGVVFDSWELTLGDAVYNYADNPLVLDGNATCFSETTNSTCYVRAKFKWLKYQIDYNANGDHGMVTPDTNKYIYTNEVALASANPSDGYGFAGWTTNATEGTLFVPGQVVTGADIGATTSGVVTLYANWTQNVYTVTFCYTNSQGAADSTVQSVRGTENAQPPDATAYDSWVGHKFVGWDASYSNVVSDVTVNALYEDDQGGGGQGDDPGGDPEEPQYYVVTFDANGGECEEDARNVNCGDAVGGLPEAVRDSYMFDGWFTSDGAEVTAATVPDTNVTYYAKWSYDGLFVTGTNLAFEVKEAVLLAFDECFFVESASELKSVTVSGLPSGVKFAARTRTFSGAPTKAGLFYVTCVVKNEGGYQYSCTATWDVGNTSSTDNDNGNIGAEVLAQLDNLVTGYAYELVGFTNATAVTGLPTGLKFTKATGVISGTPTKPGKAAVTLTGVNKAKSVKTVIVVDGGMHALELDKAAVGSTSATGKPTGDGVYAVGKKVTIKATAAKGSVFAGWYGDDGDPLVGSADFRTVSFPYVMGDRKTTLTAAFATEEEDKASLHFENVTNVTAAADGSLELDLSACVKSLSLPKLSLTGLPSGLKYDAKTLKVSGAAKKPGVYTVKVAATNTSVKKATADTTTTFTVTVPNFECDALPKLKPETDAYDMVRCGVALGPELINCMPVDADWTVKVAGLPAGLKLVRDKTTKAYSITGVSTAKAGSYTVTFTASKKGEKNQVATITLNVEALPEWAVGTFDGGLLSTEEDVLGLVQGLAVTANGKVSGKLINGDGTWTLAAASFDAYDATLGEYVATVIGKSGKLAFTNEVAVSVVDFNGSHRGQAEMLGDGVKAEAVQNLWKTTFWKAVAKGFANKKLTLDVEGVEGAFTSGTLELKFAASGAATAGGKFVTGYNEKTKRDIVYSASCSAVLIPQGGNEYVVYLYFPPKKDAKGNVTFAGYSAKVRLEWNGTMFVQHD